MIPAVETAVVMTNGLEDNKQEYGTGCVLESMFTINCGRKLILYVCKGQDSVAGVTGFVWLYL